MEHYIELSEWMIFSNLDYWKERVKRSDFRSLSPEEKTKATKAELFGKVLANDHINKLES